jgi:hypothetical protein
MSLNDRDNLVTEDIAEDQETPANYLSVDLVGDEREELERWLLGHYRAIMTAMEPVLARFERERNQHNGDMPGADWPYPGAFRVNYPVTKKKVREVSNRIKKAILDSDPIWAFTVEKSELNSYAQQLESALDSAARHEARCEDDISQATLQSVLHGAGFLSPSWEYDEDVHRGVEKYIGFDGETAQSVQGLMQFEENYPNWQDNKEARRLHAQIFNGKDVEKVVTYTAPTVNTPTIRYVACENVRVYPHVEGFSGLRSTPAYGFVSLYTRTELEDLADEEFIEAEQLERLLTGKDQRTPTNEVEQFEIFECTLRYRLGSDKNPTRYKAWMDTRTGIIIRLRAFYWWNNDPDLIPMYSRNEEAGFFKPGMAEDLKEIHVVLIAILNLFLNSADLTNAMKFKAKEGSLAMQYLLSRRWSPHLPIPWKNDPNEVDPMVVNSAPLQHLVTAFQLMKQQADDETQTSSLQSGRESPTDPSAPASKVALLLQQVEPNMTEMIRSLEPGLRYAGKALLLMYYQGIKLGWIDEIPGAPDLPTDNLPELANAINPRMLLFESDRAGRQERNIAVLKLFGEVFPGNPQLLAEVFKKVLSQWDSYWAREVDNIPWESLAQPQMPQGAVSPGMPGAVPPSAPQNGMPEARGAVANALG